MDPKLHFANERTFLNWFTLSVIIGGETRVSVSSPFHLALALQSSPQALTGIGTSIKTAKQAQGSRQVDEGSALLVVALFLCAYAVRTYSTRMEKLNAVS